MMFALNDKAKGFSRFPGDKFLNFILFLSEIGIYCAYGLRKNSALIV